MNTWWAVALGVLAAFLSLSLGASGNLVILLLTYGIAIFFLEGAKGVGVWYLVSVALITDLIGTSHFGEHFLLAALTYVAQYVLVERLRFTAPANRRALAISLTCMSAVTIFTNTPLVHIYLLAVGSLIILLSINYLLSDHSSPLRYADS